LFRAFGFVLSVGWKIGIARNYFNAIAVDVIARPADRAPGFIRERLRVRAPETEVMLTLDGQVSLAFRPGQSVRVTRAARPIWFLQAEERSFYEVLRAKLRWGGA
jgi:hypothetical protein